MTTAPVFYDIEAEECVLGACLLSRTAVESTLALLDQSDFGSQNLSAVFGAIGSLHRKGAPIDAKTVLDELGSLGTIFDGAASVLMSLQSNTPAISSAPRYAEIVARFTADRRLAGAAAELAEAARDRTVDPYDALEAHRARLAEIDSPVLTRSPGDLAFDDFIAEDDDLRPPVIAGLLAEDDRVVIVAPEGVGKSELERQIVTCTAYGIHPLTFRPIAAVPTLLVDLENPRALVRDRLRKLTSTAQYQATGERAPATLWHRPGGIDLRRRADRIAFEDVLRRNRPKLVALGPVYKSYQRKASETDEQVAAEVQTILDDLRTRYTFALILEHHAPQASNGVRDLRPFGSSLWLRWPEYGLSLKPDRERPRNVLHLGRWRGDRSQANWPDEIHRSDVWPWQGWWRDGIDDEPLDGSR